MKTIVITGGTSGLGYEVVKKYKDSYKIIIVSGNQKKGNNIILEFDNKNMSYINCNLENMDEVFLLSKELRKECKTIDILINNAGIFRPPYRLTKDDMESQFAINYLSHFYLTNLLLDIITDKVIHVSSLAHKMKTADIHFDDISLKNKYTKWIGYQQSKLANAMFGYELDNRLKINKSKVKSIVVHPGVSSTKLFNQKNIFIHLMFVVGIKLKILNTQEQGAYCFFKAIEDTTLKGGEFIGPIKYKERCGEVGFVNFSAAVLDQNKREKLWSLSKEVLNYTKV